MHSVVFSYFVAHFKAHIVERPDVDNLQFRTLTLMEGVNLIKPFRMEDGKAAVWDCENYKSPGLDDIIFYFIKEFWNEIKYDIMKFISSFIKMEG